MKRKFPARFGGGATVPQRLLGSRALPGTIDNTDTEFGFTPMQIQMHGVIGGGSGYGKSTMVKILSQQILSEGKVKLWIIDPKPGGDYRFLTRQFDALVLNRKTLKCNPFTRIENVPVDMLRETLSEVTADSFGVYDASEAMIAKHVQQVFHEHDQPCLSDFVASLGKEKVRYGGRKQGYLDGLDTRLIKARISLGEIVDCRRDYFSHLYDRSVVFELGELSGSAQRVLAPWIIMKLVLYKVKNPTVTLSHLLVFDEAQSQLWSRQLEMRGRQSYMATLATQCRAFGLGIMVLAQNPATKLMTEILANSCIKVAFHLGSGVEIYQMSQHMGLSGKQMQKLYELKRQEAICRVGMGYMKPLSLRLNDFHDQQLSDHEMDELMKPQWDELMADVESVKHEPEDAKPVGKSAEKSGKGAENAKATGTANAGTTDAKKKSDTVQGMAEEGILPETRQESLQLDRKKADNGLRPSSACSDDEKAYLRVTVSHPWRLVTEVYALLNDERVMGTERIGRNRAVKARRKLIRMGYIQSFRVMGTGKQGRPQCDVPTELAGLGKVYKPRGGDLHAWWCYRIGQFYRNEGGEVKPGDTSSGNECDLSVSLAGRNLGVEVVVSGLVVDNLSRHLSYYDEAIVACVDDEVRVKVMKLVGSLDDSIKSRVSIRLVREFFIPL